MSTVEASPLEAMAGNATLLRAMIGAVDSCFGMCDMQARCVGMSAVPMRDPGKITGMIGLHGQVSGFITVNMSEQVAMKAIGGLLGESFEQVTPQVVDGAGEMTNIIAGGVKNALSGTPWSFSHVTVPSVIIGQNYQIAYAGGLEYVAAAFEHQDRETLMLDDRLLQVAISLIRL
ncbi:MAG: chemotaxis protein CheX [Thermoguttaceae bacterium]